MIVSRNGSLANTFTIISEISANDNTVDVAQLSNSNKTVSSSYWKLGSPWIAPSRFSLFGLCCFVPRGLSSLRENGELEVGGACSGFSALLWSISVNKKHFIKWFLKQSGKCWAVPLPTSFGICGLRSDQLCGRQLPRPARNIAMASKGLSNNAAPHSENSCGKFWTASRKMVLVRQWAVVPMLQGWNVLPVPLSLVGLNRVFIWRTLASLSTLKYLRIRSTTTSLG